ncbi:MAG: YqaA family protein [Xanthomonadales bacterium]|nr:YqaA family protein [Xanthomonadales bacterium]
MALFEPLYDKALKWSAHRHAPYYLVGLSASESVFFPVPPDVMLIPMTLAQRARGWAFAALCTVASVVGGLVGYLLGYYAFTLMEPLIERAGYTHAFEMAQQSFETYGFWVVLAAGFSPIPYKVFTIASGVAGMPFLPYVLGSILGRGGRFFLVAGLIVLGGERMADGIRRHVEWLGWLVVALIAVVLAWLALR